MAALDENSLRRMAWRNTALFAVALWLMIFVPAGTLHFAEGWLFWAVFMLCCVVISAYFLRRDPELVARRMAVGPTAETDPMQKRIQAFASMLTIVMFVVPGLDHRFGWSLVPWPLVLAGNALVVLGFAMIARVFQENSFAAATVQVAEGQRVIDTGPYALVRHPMYTGALVMFFGCPLALGSWWALALLAPLAWVLVLRLTDEERYLSRNLPGYAEYQQKVRWRLAPLIW